MRLALCLAAALLLGPSVVSAQVPQQLGYQGRLLKADGTPESGMVKIVFRLHDAETGGKELWAEEQVLGLTDGYYATFLGQKTPLPPAAFEGGDRYLELVVDDTALTPRQKVGSVAYALLAGEARSLKGGLVDASAINVGGKPVIDAMGNLVGGIAGNFANKAHTHDAAEVTTGKLDLLRIPTGPGSKLDADTVDGREGADFVLKTDVSTGGTLNDAANPVDWTRLKNVPPQLAAGGAVNASAPLSGAGTAADPLRLGTASATASGALGSADYLRFEGKLDRVAATAPLAGEGTAGAPLVLPRAALGTDGYLAGADFEAFSRKLGTVAASGPLTGNGTTASPLALPRAGSGLDGYLSGADFDAFSNKLSAVTVTAPLAGSGSAADPLTLRRASLSVDGYLAAADFDVFSKKLSAISVAGPLTGAGTPASPVTLARASASADGYLGASDFVAFHGKLSTVAAAGPLAGNGTTGSPLTLGRASSTTDGYLAAADFASLSARLASVSVLGPLAGNGTPSNPLSLGRAGTTTDGFLSQADFVTFNNKLSAVAASAPLTGSGTSGSPLGLARATATADGYLASADFAAFSNKVGSVAAGTGIAVTGTTTPTVAVRFGSTAGTAVEGNDPRLVPVNGYIQNQAGGAQAASFNINGNGTVGGNVGIGTAATSAYRLEVAGRIKSANLEPFSATVAWNGPTTVYRFNAGDDSTAKLITVSSLVSCAGFSAVLAVTAGYAYCNVSVVSASTRGGTATFSCLTPTATTHELVLNSQIAWSCSGSPPTTYGVTGTAIDSR